LSDTLQGFDPDSFFADYWQQQPLVMHGALPDFIDPLSPEELAGLALEDDVESRIVSQRDGRWQLQHGPFGEPDFQRHGPWTLLVQAVDHHVPAVAALRRLVPRLPGWRMDDVMVSFAADGGGVGPHYDNYDVFLLQGHGQREWRVGARCDGSEALVDHPDLRLLADMPVQQTVVLSPGDILYLPPRFAHWGIARGDCLTYSIGFRAPSRNALLARWVDHVLEGLDPEVFYRDPQQPACRPGEISAAALAEASRLVRETVAEADFSDPRWFGELVTEPRGAIEQGPASPAINLRGVALRPDARLAWSEVGDGGWLFANGETLPCDRAGLRLAESLCRDGSLGAATLSTLRDEGQNHLLLQELMALGCIDVTT
jgi:50S ribosomal protein L16 3-hydroxylase